MPTPVLSPDDFAPAFQLLRDRLGLDAAVLGTRMLESAVRERLSFHSGTCARDYAYRLSHDPRELEALTRLVVVGETWFFRDDTPFRFLADFVRQRAGAGRALNILSLPCSTGEEPYSVAMTLLAEGLRPDQFAIDAVDVNPASIEFARCGIYTKSSLRNVDAMPLLLAHSERRADGLLEIDPRVRAQVQFRVGNLLDPHSWPAGREYDVILCRNLLIYLHGEARRNAVASLRRQLRDDGLLIVGHAEVSAALFGAEFVHAGPPGSFAYQLRGQGAATEKNESHAERPVRRASGKELAARKSPATTPARTAPLPRPATASLPAPRPAPAPVSLLNQARSLADRGQYAEAVQRCEEHLRQEPENAEGHYLHGLLLEAMEQPHHAETAHRRALYLEPAHYNALVHLSLLLETRGAQAEAARLRARASRQV